MIVKNVERPDNKTITFQVEVSTEEFEESLSGAYLKNRKNIAVPGFRKGKAPRMVIEGMYGANIFYDDAIEDIGPKAFEYAVTTEELKTVGRPEITNADISDEKALELSFSVAAYPEVSLGQYKGIEAEKLEINITDLDVDKYLEEMRKRNGRQTSVEREAVSGDTVVLDYDGYLDGERFDGGQNENQRLELGSNTFVPGFEDQMIGMKAGDERDINITFPEDYHENLAGKAVVFKVKVHEVIETELPELDDEFAKDVSEFDTLDEYKKVIMDELVTQRTKAVDEDFGVKVMTKATENMTCDLPEAMIEERMYSIMNEYDRSLMNQGMRLEEYMRLSGMDPVSFQNIIRPQAEAQLKTDLLLAAIAEAEDIQVSDEELEESIKGIAESYSVSVEQIKAAVPVASMIDDMRKKKANDIIMESAVALAPTEETEAAE